MDYSIYDAIEAGFNKVVFIISACFADEFIDIMTPKFGSKIKLRFVTQNMDDLPTTINTNNSRSKPWGTAHAVWAARNVIDEPFLVINADDYYGKKAYKMASKHITEKPNDYAVLGYRLGNTLSNYGGVNRGLCMGTNKVNGTILSKIVEVKGLRKSLNGVFTFSEPKDFSHEFDDKDLVSMNMFCLNQSFFTMTKLLLTKFLLNSNENNLAEILIPDVVDFSITDTDIKTWILSTNSSWFGVTYKPDKIMATYKIQDKINKGLYPKTLFESFTPINIKWN